MKSFAKAAALILLCALLLSLFTVPAAAQTKPGYPYVYPAYQNRGLSYDLKHDSSAGELVFTVTNNTFWPYYLSYSSGKQFDLVVYNDQGQKVWRYSDGRTYTQAIQNEWLYPWQAKTFKAKLPRLRAGKYIAYAYFYGRGNSSPAAYAQFTVNNGITIGGLEFNAWYSGGTQPRIVLSVYNRTNNTVRLEYPTGQRYEVIVLGSSGYYWRYSANQSFDRSPRSEDLKAGVYRSYYIYLPDMPSGSYTAYVYFLDRTYKDLVDWVKFTVN
ncbi:MAG: BsuPI-related putative proteinase inhibitor [Peptococcaceae bacterium]|nr:BsuPI-related putative proteinase inhibitor [Peptococcaceae bacterium]MDH7525395.1 BsuPI-related putative proteinase inhibitor [Peptococcaceae bacterium]